MSKLLLQQATPTRHLQHELAGKELAEEAASRTLEAENAALKAELAALKAERSVESPGAAAPSLCQTTAHADGRHRLQLHRGLRERGGASCWAQAASSPQARTTALDPKSAGGDEAAPAAVSQAAEGKAASGRTPVRPFVT
jgi:hypothetical protein